MEKITSFETCKISFIEMNEVIGGGTCATRCEEPTHAYNGANNDTSISIYNDQGELIKGWSTAEY